MNSNKPVIGITGATGLIGSALYDSLKRNGYQVTRLIRNPDGHTDRKYSLEKGPAPELLAGIDVLIHCAYDKNDSQVETGTNYTGSRQLFENANYSGVSHIIFMSSIAAQTTIRSSYGQSKLAIEKLLDHQTHTIIRPGLIIGNGGLFKRLREAALTKKFIPLIGNGQQPLQWLAIADLQKAVLQIIEENKTGKFVLANNENLTYKNFFIRLGAFYKKRMRFIKIGIPLLLASVRMASFVGIQLPISRENILGLISQQYEPPTSTHPVLSTSLEQALSELEQR